MELNAIFEHSTLTQEISDETGVDLDFVEESIPYPQGNSVILFNFSSLSNNNTEDNKESTNYALIIEFINDFATENDVTEIYLTQSFQEMLMA